MTNPETARTKDTTRTTITAREVVDIEFDRDDDISVGNTVGVEVGTAVGSWVGTQAMVMVRFLCTTASHMAVSTYLQTYSHQRTLRLNRS